MFARALSTEGILVLALAGPIMNLTGSSPCAAEGAHQAPSEAAWSPVITASSPARAFLHSKSLHIVHEAKLTFIPAETR